MLFSKKNETVVCTPSPNTADLCNGYPTNAEAMLLEKEYLDTWMHRLMDMLERIESKQKPPKMPEYAVLENGDKLLDNFDLCRMLHVSKRTLQRYRTECGLPYHLLNQKTYHRESEVLRFIETNLDKLHNLREKGNNCKDI